MLCHPPVSYRVLCCHPVPLQVLCHPPASLPVLYHPLVSCRVSCCHSVLLQVLCHVLAHFQCCVILFHSKFCVITSNYTSGIMAPFNSTETSLNSSLESSVGFILPSPGMSSSSRSVEPYPTMKKLLQHLIM